MSKATAVGVGPRRGSQGRREAASSAFVPIIAGFDDQLFLQMVNIFMLYLQLL